MPELPTGFAEQFSKAASAQDDPALYPRKADLIAVAERVRAATVQWIKSLSPTDLEKPAPEPMRSFVPTSGTWCC